MCRRPVSLEGLLDIKAKHNAAKLVVGNTEVGIELKFKHAGYPVLVGTTHVQEMNTIEVRRSAGASHVCQQYMTQYRGAYLRGMPWYLSLDSRDLDQLFFCLS